MIDILPYVVVILLLLFSLSTFLPLIPQGILSAITITVYWWHTNTLNVWVFIVLLLFCIFVTVMDLLSGIVAGKLSGARNGAVLLGTLIGIVLVFLIGPVGLLVGLAGTIFLYSFYKENEEKNIAVKKSVITVVGVFTSNVIQFITLLFTTLLFSVATLPILKMF